MHAQIDNFLKRASTITTKHKDTPYIALKKEGSNNRSNLLATYYKQFSKQSIKPAQNMTMGAPGRNQDIGSLIGDLGKKLLIFFQILNYKYRQKPECSAYAIHGAADLA